MIRSQPSAGRSSTRLAPTLALILPLAALIHADSSSSIVPTKNYIDTISGYAALSSCAESVLSTVVRGEYSGCPDTYALTSYTCFCTDSSSYMSAVISQDVISRCATGIASEQASSAGVVFDAYCALGVSAGLNSQAEITAAASSSSSTATPAGTASASTVYVTTTPTTASSSYHSSAPTSTTTAIAIGVLVAVCGILLILAAWFIWRRRKRRTMKTGAWPAAADGGRAEGNPHTQTAVEAPGCESAVEVPAREPFVEVPVGELPVEMGTWEYRPRVVGTK